MGVRHVFSILRLAARRQPYFKASKIYYITNIVLLRIINYPTPKTTLIRIPREAFRYKIWLFCKRLHSKWLAQRPLKEGRCCLDLLQLYEGHFIKRGYRNLYSSKAHQFID